MRFVVADDSSVMRDVIVGALQSAGHQCVGVARDGGEAIEQCDKQRPDVVLLDISMIPVSGSDAARVIVAAKSAAHVVIQSSAAIASICDDLKAIGCSILAKPYKPEKLVELVGRLQHGPPR